MTCRARLKSVRPTIVSRDPYIALYPKLFSAAECRYLMILGTPWMEKASILNLSGEAAFDPARDASAAHIPPVAEDLVVQEVNRCIADATGTEPGWCEPLNILRYAPGQQYKPHHYLWRITMSLHTSRRSLSSSPAALGIRVHNPYNQGSKTVSLTSTHESPCIL